MPSAFRHTLTDAEQKAAKKWKFLRPLGWWNRGPKWGSHGYKLLVIILQLGGGFKYVLFSSLLGEMIQFDQHFSHGLKPPTSSTWGSWGCWTLTFIDFHHENWWLTWHQEILGPFPGEPYVLRVPSHQLGCATWHLTRWGYGIPKGKETNFPTIRGFVYPGEDVLLVFWRVPPQKKNSRHEYENSNPRMSKSPWSWRRSKILEVQKIGVPPNRLPGRKVNPEEVGWNRRKLRSWSLVGFYGRLYSSRLVVVSYISETIKR